MFSGDRADLMAALAKERLNYDEWRKEMKDHVVVMLMRKMNVEQNVTVSAKAVRRKYEENTGLYKAPARIKLRMIVLGGDVPGGEAGVARKKAEELRKKLAGGADFAETAKTQSEGNKAADGGDWGWIEPKILRPELAAAAAQLKKGEISQVIEGGDQFYILKAEDMKDEAVASFAEVQSQIERELRRAEAEKAYGVWIERLRKNAYVKVFDTDLF
jgi:parvulin-like peptidyl-prolyl isomerase